MTAPQPWKCPWCYAVADFRTHLCNAMSEMCAAFDVSPADAKKAAAENAAGTAPVAGEASRVVRPRLRLVSSLTRKEQP